ncbi:DM13 domain-containing protein [Halegenticoccus tardaugens]|uniref:DM13 domain-containing protein n=1 Tax=Halegenticoccus tardaugens TaxID=2071624 RepID=UPI00100A3056|nr:DM13 domain-containing protein [Halegenticoccus tardaugens]
MKRRTLLVGAGALGTAAVGGTLAAELFLPERSTAAAEGSIPPDADALKEGSFVGKDGHRVSGTVTLYRDGDGHFLRFEDYEQTQGPDVFVYVTPAPDPDTSEEIAEGRKVLIDGGADGGESTKVGTFVQRLPEGTDPEGYEGVSIWCDRFAVPFGAATLEPV